MLPTSADRNARALSVVQLRSEKVAPVTTTDSPSAMMMNPAQRSAMWPPLTAQSPIEDLPSFGTQKRTAGDRYSMASATVQSVSRHWPSAKPPAIQNTAEVDSQTRMRNAFSLIETCAGGIDTN